MPSNVEVTPGHIPALALNVAVRSVADGGVLLDTSSGQIFSCNETASDFLARVDGETSIAAISAAMAKEFDVSETVLCGDMVELVADLSGQGLLNLK